MTETRVPRKVTQAEFNQIACNRCGQCCEAFWQPGADELALRTSAHLGYTMDELLGWGLSVEQIIENDRLCSWWQDLVPLGEVDSDGRWRYRCRRFARLSDGTGICTQYERRPFACRSFPNVKDSDQAVHLDGPYPKGPNLEHDQCAWFVEVIES